MDLICEESKSRGYVNAEVVQAIFAPTTSPSALPLFCPILHTQPFRQLPFKLILHLYRDYHTIFFIIFHSWEVRMRLLNTSTLQLCEFFGRRIPDYAILSHTWGEEEILFSDMQVPEETWMTKKGATKVLGFCRIAQENGFDWVWIDTCCIDKSSSSELSEAINSMYEWYRLSYTCYVYLADVNDAKNFLEEFRGSRWFTRGWTLQELIAPTKMEFYTADWEEIGTKDRLSGTIASTTQIDEGVLVGTAKLSTILASVKMSWASKRRTTREEDTVYSLLGIFGVNMPLLYGESAKAFVRLQEEIRKDREDYTLFARDKPSVLAREPNAFARDASWLLSSNNFPCTGPAVQSLMPSSEPSRYKIVVNILGQHWDIAPDEPPRPTAQGMRMMLPVIESDDKDIRFAFIFCCTPDHDLICLVLQKPSGRWSKDQYEKKGITLASPEKISLRSQVMYVTDES